MDCAVPGFGGGALTMGAPPPPPDEDGGGAVLILGALVTLNDCVATSWRMTF